MGRARGSNALLNVAFETGGYGVTPAAAAGVFLAMPFVSSTMGEDRQLIASDLLGFGREPRDPTYDVANNVGDLVVPVDVRNLGQWLKLFFGPATTAVSGFATAAWTFTAQPVANATITVNGTVFTFVAAGAAGPQINIGATLAATLTAAAVVLNASVVAGVALAAYAATATVLTATLKLAGPAGNAFTAAASVAPASAATVSGATASGGTNAHTFVSGALTLPSMSAEIGLPDVPFYSTHYGMRANMLKVALTRSGLLNATLSLIAQGETAGGGASVAGAGASAPVATAITRFAQAAGSIKRNGTVLGAVVQGDFTYSNNLETLATIRSDGRIEDVDPGMVKMTGSLTTRFADTTLLGLAQNGTPVDLSYGWSAGAFSLVVDSPRVYLPVVKRPIAGPNGIQVQSNWEASGQGVASTTVTLINDVANYA